MKLLHISDIHFGMENYSKLDPQTGLSTRLLDFTSAFDRAIDRALDAGVDAAIFTGDAYKSRDPNPTVQREFAKRISRLSKAGVPVFLLTGNHDLPNMATRAHSIEIFETLAVPNVYVARKIDSIRINTRSGPLQVVALPWLTRSNLLSKEEYRNRTLEELNQVMLDKMSMMLHAQIQKLDPKIPSVLAVHASLDGATVGSERSIMLGQDLCITKSMLNADHFDYVAFGHIHKHQDFVAGDTPIVYAGSLGRIDFGEEKEDKGFVLVEIDDPGGGRLSRRTDWLFVADKAARRFHTVELNLEDLPDDALISPTEEALRRLRNENTRIASGEGIKDAVVRLKIKLRAEQEAVLREEELRQALEKEFEVYYIAAINREVERARRTRLAGLNVEELTPLQLLEKYLQSRNIPQQRLELLLKHAKALINGATPLNLENLDESQTDSLLPATLFPL
jgi:exonuclease SbcD